MSQLAPDSEDPATRHGSQNWFAKFGESFRGLFLGLLHVRRRNASNSFVVHVPAAIVVLAAGWYCALGTQWMCILIGCIAMVWIAELFNTSIECLARAITKEHNEEIRNALDVSSGAVLLASLFAAIIGAAAFLFG